MNVNIRGVFTMAELLNGSNPKADEALARDLGVTLSPEQDEVPPVVLGNPGYQTDAKGEPVELKRPNFYTKFNGKTWADDYAEMDKDEQRGFRAGFLAARGELVRSGGLDFFDKLTELFEWLYATKK